MNWTDLVRINYLSLLLFVNIVAKYHGLIVRSRLVGAMATNRANKCDMFECQIAGGVVGSSYCHWKCGKTWTTLTLNVLLDAGVANAESTDSNIGIKNCIMALKIRSFRGKM